MKPPFATRPARLGFTLIELLVVIAIIGVLIALLLPAVQSAREAARRAQCTNNLKQLALAAQNYVDSNGVLPSHGFWQRNASNPAAVYYGHSVFSSMLPFLEQGTIANAVNYNLPAFGVGAGGGPVHWTVAAIGLNTLWCPSDTVEPTPLQTGFYGTPTPGNPSTQHHLSYAGNSGTWPIFLSSTDSRFRSHIGNATGLVYHHSAMSLAGIRDGTSNTLLFGEKAHGILDPAEAAGYGWWNSGYWGDGTFDTMFPMNAHRRLREGIEDGLWFIPVQAASSFHPGGCNFAFADGSVRFIKETVQSWQNDLNNSGDPVGTAWIGSIQSWQLQPGAFVGVYQSLSTRKGGEVISADQF
ncbi:DUF1559 domain-containing protein [Tautonia rosea]|uniref:DUF1559 domain-containing protein n=1 Tax=Tautonia rosea TaxID=2728037 RepID=UPI001474CA0B|nr:DUF1559 domain-containing protein [Tautonia rosea]